MKRRCILALTMMLATTAASAEIFKCKGADGKIVISDVRCPDMPLPPPPPKEPEDDSPARYHLTDADKARVKTLDAIVDGKTSNDEQKSAAQLELGNIRMGAEVRLTAQDKAKREALVSQLVTSDKQKRAELIGQIRAFYDK